MNDPQPKPTAAVVRIEWADGALAAIEARDVLAVADELARAEPQTSYLDDDRPLLVGSEPYELRLTITARGFQITDPAHRMIGLLE